MTQDERTYFDTMEDLFSHKGWKLLSEQFKKEIYQLQADTLDIKTVPNWDVLNFNRGRAVEMAEFIRMPEIIQVEKQAMTDAED